jgi:hypothetical protein
MEGVLTSICRRLDNITFPTDPDEVRRTKMGFYRLARFPNVLGAIDGTLIKIQAPKHQEASFVCRKNYHALNVQAIADSSLR